MAERVYMWSTGIALGLVVVLVSTAIADVGSPIGEIVGGFTFLAFLTSFVSWKMAGEPGRDNTYWIEPGGGLVVLITGGLPLLVPTAVYADPGILPGAQQGSESGMKSLILLGVFVLVLAALFFFSWCVEKLAERPVRKPPDGPSALLLVGGTLLTAPSLAHALEHEVADVTRRIAEHARGEIDISSAIVVAVCMFLLMLSIRHPSRQASNVHEREVAPIE